MDLLLEFERSLENACIYAYENWEYGEIVAGPEISRYWITVTLMFPETLKPDLNALKRLEKYGCIIDLKTDIFKYPMRVKGPQSYRDTKSKKTRLVDVNVQLIKIDMPRRYIDERITDRLSSNTTTVDTSELDSAYTSQMPTDNG